MVTSGLSRGNHHFEYEWATSAMLEEMHHVVINSFSANRRCIVEIVSRSCANRRCIVDMRTNVSFATDGPDMKLFKFPMGYNSKWKSCLLRKCLFSIAIILQSIIIAFFCKRRLVFIVNKQWTHP